MIGARARRVLGYVGFAVLIVATLCFIFGHSLKTASQSNALSDGVLNKVDPIVTSLLQGITGEAPDTDSKQFFIRKTGHFLEFALLGGEWMALALYHSRKIRSALLFMPPFATLFCAVIDELIQSFLDRTSSVRDVCLDFCGGVAGMVAVIVFVLTVRAIRARLRERT